MSATRSLYFGAEIAIPSQHPDGHWCNAVVNLRQPDGRYMVAAPGHAKSNIVLVRAAAYKVEWCWPEDVGMKPVGVKSALLEDVEG